MTATVLALTAIVATAVTVARCARSPLEALAVAYLITTGITLLWIGART